VFIPVKKPGTAGLFHGRDERSASAVRHPELRFFHLGQLRVADHLPQALQVVHLAAELDAHLCEFLLAFLQRVGGLVDTLDAFSSEA
jgi:hypothetical protein